MVGCDLFVSRRRSRFGNSPHSTTSFLRKAADEKPSVIKGGVFLEEQIIRPARSFATMTDDMVITHGPSRHTHALCKWLIARSAIPLYNQELIQTIIAAVATMYYDLPLCDSKKHVRRPKPDCFRTHRPMVRSPRTSGARQSAACIHRQQWADRWLESSPRQPEARLCNVP